MDAGFGCPGRDAGRPCAYCDPRGSRAPYLGSVEPIEEQVDAAIAFLRGRYRAERFLLYFQAHSNTYGPVPVLRRAYDAGIARADFSGLIVATRPDCLDEERADLLAGFLRPGFDVWVELGLQSASDRTLERIGRGHTVARFDRAVDLAKSRGLLVAAHVILGLPGDGRSGAVNTARHLSAVGVDGVKFHNLVLVEGTPLYHDYLRGAVMPPSPDGYRELLIAALCELDPGIVVMRLTCDPPPGVISVPAFPEKAAFVQDLERTLRARDLRQGVYYTRPDGDQGCRPKTKRS